MGKLIVECKEEKSKEDVYSQTKETAKKE